MTFDPEWAARMVEVEGWLNQYGDFEAVYVEGMIVVR